MQNIRMDFETFKSRYNVNLTSQQLAAVQSVDNPTLLLAVPGSGKTTVLVTRLGYMIFCRGIAPESILTITYTVAATKDMRNRFALIFGQQLADRMEFRTINGICAKIIQYYGRCVGKKPYELLNDESVQNRLLLEIYRHYEKGYPTESDLKTLSTLITYIKNMSLDKNAIAALGERQSLSNLYEMYKSYCDAMKDKGVMDFDDQMVYARTMLTHVPFLREHFQKEYPYICVDEAQDTSKIQHEIIDLLSGNDSRLFMVGDEDQSIYGFRAAYPEALLHFEKKHTNAQVLLMETNFRSNARIVEVADKFIQQNRYRHPKRMVPSRPEGAQIKQISVKNRKGQYQVLMKEARLLESQGNSDKITAVLYRDNESAIPFINMLEEENIPYKCRNADLTFFSNRVVNDIRDIIRFAYDMVDVELFMRIYYKLELYMSRDLALKACRISERKNIPVLEAAVKFLDLPSNIKKNAKTIQTHLNNLKTINAADAVYRIQHYMGYSDYLERNHIKPNKVEILEEIGRNLENPKMLLQRLDELNELIKEKEYDPRAKLVLSTVHSSKGLEYDSVYLLDVIDGVFPEKSPSPSDKMSDQERRDFEEERRLFYVAMTRAKENLSIFKVETRSSVFIQEINRPKVNNKATVKQKNIKVNSYLKKTPYGVKKSFHKVTESEYRECREELSLTGYLKHKTLGEGEIISMPDDLITACFEDNVQKTFSLKYLLEHDLLEM